MKTHLRKLQSGDGAQGVAEYAIMFGIVLALVLGIAVRNLDHWATQRQSHRPTSSAQNS